ncbi:aminopeptidase P family N-terminal domain-containing protein [Thermanaerovibrio velox]|uniref:aminopeptidase P family N-terminal domain-containing protein n=1 Tax=Thermanaerovibrio velox TaxID=108007 RepID=UPI0003098563|nr:aminopeptidase P family N-terminal domain-containing protein [Thermanaerovibrio velox]
MNLERLERLMERLEEEGLDGLFVGPSGDLLYLVGLDLFQDERCKGLMVSRKGCFGLVPLLYRQEMGRHMEGVPLFVWDDRDGFAGAFGEGCRSLGLEGGGDRDKLRHAGGGPDRCSRGVEGPVRERRQGLGSHEACQVPGGAGPDAQGLWSGGSCDG